MYMDMDIQEYYRYNRYHRYLRKRSIEHEQWESEIEKDLSVPMLLHCFSSSINEVISFELSVSLSWHRALRPRNGCVLRYLASQSKRQSQTNWLSWRRLWKKKKRRCWNEWTIDSFFVREDQCAHAMGSNSVN